MTTPDIAGLCERLRRLRSLPSNPLARSGFGQLVNPDGPKAADTLERQAAEIERLRKGLSRLFNEKRPADHDCIDAGEPQCVWCDAEEILARAALTGEDAGRAG